MSKSRRPVALPCDPCAPARPVRWDILGWTGDQTPTTNYQLRADGSKQLRADGSKQLRA